MSRQGWRLVLSIVLCATLLVSAITLKTAYESGVWTGEVFGGITSFAAGGNSGEIAAAVITDQANANQPPKWIGDKKKFTVTQNGRIVLNLNTLFSDPEGAPLTYIATQAEDLRVDLQDYILTIDPEYNFVGERVVAIIASDGEKVTTTRVKIEVVAKAQPALPEVLPTPAAEAPVLNETVELNETVQLNETNATVELNETAQINETNATVELNETAQINETNATVELNETVQLNETNATLVNETAQEGVSVALNGAITDEAGKNVGKKIAEEKSYETFFKFVGEENSSFVVRFYHNSTTALPIWIEGGVPYSLSPTNAEPGTEVNLTVPLNGTHIPFFKLHVGAESEIFSFGTQDYHTMDTIEGCPVLMNTSSVLTASISSATTCITFNADNIALDCAGYTITFDTGGGGSDYGISVKNHTGASITGCTIRDTNAGGASGYGIYFLNVNSSNVINNTIQTNGTSTNYGIHIQYNSSNNTIANNTIMTKGTNTNNYGIYLLTHNTYGNVSANLIENNTILTNGTSSNHGVVIDTNTANSFYLMNNTINNNTIVTGAATSGGTNYGIYFYQGIVRNRITDNTITTGSLGGNSNYGIYINSVGSQNVIAGNTINAKGAATSYGMYFTSYASNNTIENNTINTRGSGASNYGLYISSNSNNDTVRFNNITTYGTSSNYGIRIDTTVHNHTIEDNIILANGTADSNWGITLNSNANNNSIRGNTVRAQGTYQVHGIVLQTTSVNNVIANNTVFSNGTSYGGYAVVATGGSDNLQIYDNNLSVKGADGLGIALDSILSAKISGNNITGPVGVKGFYIYGGSMLQITTAEVTITNTMNGSPIYFYGGAGNSPACPTNQVLDNPTASQINLIGCNNITISNFNSFEYVTLVNTSNSTITYSQLRNVNAPVKLFFNSTGNTISYNNITATNTTGAAYGVWLQFGASNNTITNNNITALSPSAASNYGIFITGNSSENNITSNTISVNGTTDSYGIYLYYAANKNLVANNTIYTRSATGTSNMHGILLYTSVEGNTILNNTIYANGTSNNHGIRLQAFASNNTIANNTITPDGSNDNYGIYLFTNVYNNTVSGNIIKPGRVGTSNGYGIYLQTYVSLNHVRYNNISTNGTGTVHGIYLNNFAQNNTIANNNISTKSTGASNYGIYLVTSSHNNTIENNTIRTNGSSNNYGIYFATTIYNNTVKNNTITASGSSTLNHGIYFTGTVLNSTVQNNKVYASGSATSYGIYLSTTVNGLFEGNNITAVGGTDSYALVMASATGSLFNNTILTNPVLWIYTDSANNFSNTTFAMPNGSITIIPKMQLNGTTSILKKDLNITYNRAYLNSTANVYFNTTGIITLSGIVGNNPQATADYTDTGVYVDCNSAVCVQQSYSGNVFVFNVSRFSSYAATTSITTNVSLAKTDNPDPVSMSTQLNYTIIISALTGNASNISVTEIYPNETFYVSAQPSPVSGTNNTFIPRNLTQGQSFTINISMFVLNLTSGALINNSVNISFNNDTGNVNTLQLVENTTVLPPPEVNNSNITITKTDLPDPVDASTNLSYQINVTSSGNTTAFNVTVNDTYPAQVIYLTSLPAPVSGTNNTWILGNLTNGTIISINVTVLVLNVTHLMVINNTANVTWQNEISNPLNSSATAGTTVNNPPPPVLFVNFTAPTPPNNTVTANRSVIINTSINSEAGLSTFKYSWNYTNYSIYSTDLVLMMNFDNQSSLGENGTMVMDASLAGNNATCPAGKCPAWTSNGRYAGAYSYNGYDTNLSTAPTGVYNGQYGSVTAWVNFSKAPADIVDYTIFSTVNNAETFGWKFEYFNNSGEYRLQFRKFNPEEAVYAASTTPLQPNTWIHLATTWSLGTKKIYLNGVLIKDASITSVTAGTDIACIGGDSRADCASQITNGTIDELRVWNVTLTDLQIYEMYSSNLQKQNTTNWEFYVNQTNNGTALDYAAYATSACGLDVTGQENCTQQDYINITAILFNLTNISITKTDSPDPVNVSTNLTYQITVSSSGNGTAYNVTVNDTYPSQVIYLTSLPAPVSGTNNTWILGNLSQGANISINITVLVLNISNGIVINNTANATWQNETSDNSSAVATAGTTARIPPPTIAQVIVNTTNPATNGTGQNVTMYVINAIDPSGAAVQNITDWRLNNGSIAPVYWPFETNTQSTAAGAIRGYSLSGFNATLAANSPTWTTSGKVGSAYSFNAINNMITSASSMDIGTNYTVEFWFNPAGGTNWQVLVGNSFLQSTNFGVMFFTTSKIWYYWNFGSTVTSTTNLQVDKWHHIALTYNGSLSKIYVNGTLEGTSAAHTERFNNSVGLGMELGGWGSSIYYGGLMDEVRVYNITLSPEQINASYFKGLAGKAVDTIVQQQTGVGEVWSACATPNDATLDGSTVCGDNVTINDDPPVIFNFTNISITKTDLPDPVTASSNLTYQVNVTSTGNTTAFNVTVNDTYPLQVIYLTSLPTPLAGTNNTWILGNLTVGTNFSINITVLVLNITNGTVINNTANATYNNETSGFLSAIATQATTVNNPPLLNFSNISITKTDLPDPVTASSNLTYQINVSSNGNGTAHNTTVNDTYPPQVIYLTSLPTPLAGTNNTWILGNLTWGTNFSINITVLVLNITNGTVINNTANATYNNDTSGFFSAIATQATTVSNPPLLNFSNISVTKTDLPDPVNVSSNLTYQINVSVTGNTTAFNVTVNDTYSARAIYLTSQPTPLAGTNNTWILGNLTQGTGISVNITVFVLNVTNGTVINNTVNVTFQNETSGRLSAVASQSTTVDSYPTSVVFDFQIPQDIDSVNLLGVPGNISYNISSPLQIVNSTVLFYYKTNSSISDVTRYVNGTETTGYHSDNYTLAYNSTYRFTLHDNDVYPATYNFEEEQMEEYAKSNYSLGSLTTYLKIRLFNVSNTSQYSFFEVYARNATGNSQSLRVYYCNSSYANQNPSATTVCTQFATILATTPYNHTHTAYSMHYVMPFAINLTSGTMGGVKVTPVSYFLLRGRSGNSWIAYYITNISSKDAIQTTTNSGTTWANLSGTVDSHMHQYDANESRWYYACANNTLGNQTCSAVRQDLLNLSGLPPTPPDVYSPISATYSGNVPINYTEALSPNAYNISFYNITLLNLTLSIVEVIRSNNSLNLSYLWDTTTTPDGEYVIAVTACDILGQCSIGYSENFTLYNFIRISNITMAKTDIPDPVNASTNLTYEINITVNANATVWNLTVNDTYPNEVIYLTSQPSPTAGNNSWTLGNLEIGTNFSINITVLVRNITNGTVLNNTANATWQNETSGYDSRLATAATTVENFPAINTSSLIVVKTDSPDPVNASSNLTYMVNVSSVGNGTAYNTTINDTYPSQVIYLTSQPAPLAGTNNTWILGNLTPGTNISINITVLVRNITNGTVINNTVNGTWQNETSYLLSAVDTEGTTVLNEPILNFTNISITKTDLPDPVTASSNLTYQINVTSTGNTTAFNVTVNDTYPLQVIYLTSLPAPLAGTNNTWILGNLTQGTNISINITVLVLNITNGAIINNTANATYNNETSGFLSAIATQATTVSNPPLLNFTNISITKTDLPDPVSASTNLTYQINVSSTGNTTAFNVTVNDTYPLQVIYLTSQPTPLAGTNNTWILGNLTQGTNISINITALVLNITNGTVINNTANATYNNETSGFLSAIATQATTVENFPAINTSSLIVVKTDSPDPVNASSNLTYMVNVSSVGNGTAYNTTINDTYPLQVIYLASQPTPLAGTNNTWILGNLTPGTNIIINITVLVRNITNGTVINNTVNGTWHNETSYLLSAVDTEGTTVLNEPILNFTNISITKTSAPDPVNASDLLTYEINITSTGNTSAFDVMVNDTYPPEVIYVSAVPVPTAGNNTWDLGDLAQGESKQIQITVLVLNITNGSVINNTVNITFNNETGGLLSLIATDATTVNNPPIINFSNVSITKTDYPDPVNASWNLTYQINVTSIGTGIAYNVTVNDTYPNEVIYLASLPDPISGTNNTWILGNLTPGTNISINITVLVLNITNGSVINNTVNGTWQNETSYLLSAVDTEGTTVNNPPILNFSNISITKTDTPDPVNVSYWLNYTITVTSNGNTTAFNVTVNDTYPAEVFYVSAQPEPSDSNNTWILGNLTQGTTILINVTVNVTADVPNGTIIYNTANVTYNNETSGLLSKLATQSTTVFNPLVLNKSNISISKADTPDPVEIDNVLNYTITVTSNGDTIAYNTTLNDTYPNEIIYISSQPTPLAGTNNTWILGNLSQSTVIVINISSLVRNMPNGTVINNTANATFQNDTGDILSVIATQSTTINNPPYYNFSNASITKTGAPDPVNTSTNLTYQINVSVTGNETTYNVTVNDTYPNEVIYLTSVPPPLAGTNNTWILGNLTVGTNISINVTVLVRNITNGTVINNTANLTFQNATGTLFRAAALQNTITQRSCPTYVSSSTTLDENVVCPATAFIIVADNVTLDCAGKTINYNTLGTDNNFGIAANGQQNITITNCIIRDVNESGMYSIGINLTNVNNSLILNNTIQTNGTNNSYGINIMTTSYRNQVINNTIQTRGSASDNYGICLFSTVSGNNITNNSITTNGTNYNHGIYLTTSANNNTVNNNRVSAGGSASDNYGIYLYSTVSGNNVTNNNVTTNGTYYNHGIYLTTSANNNTVNNNLVSTGGSANSNYGIYLINLVTDNNVTNNNVTTSGTAQNHGIVLQSSANNNLVNNNRVSAGGSANSNYGVYLVTTVSGSNITNNNITTNGTSDNYGIVLSGNANNNRVNNNLVSAGGSATANYGIYLVGTVSGNNVTNNNVTTNGTSNNYGIYLTTSVNNNLVNNNRVSAGGSSSGNYGIRLDQFAENNTFDYTNISTIGASSYAIIISSSNYSAFTRTTLNNPSQWIKITDTSQNNFTNTTFWMPNGSINIPFLTQLNGSIDINLSMLNITYNKAFLNSTNLTALNTTGIITLNALTSTNPRAIVDWNDDTAYEACPADICTRLDYTAGTLVYNVTHFTGYSSEETPLSNISNLTMVKIDSPDPVNASSNLSYQINVSIVGNGTAYNTTVNDTYPNEIIYLTSVPPPLAGTNNTWILGNLTQGTNFSINITVLVLNITNGSVINNTVNVTFQNETSNLLSAIATQNTTVLNEPLLNLSSIIAIKTGSPNPVNASSNLTYQINVSSTGNGTAYNVTVNDTYPNEIIYLTSLPTPLAGTNNTWILGNLTQGTNISINITVLILNITNGTVINNTVNVTYHNETSGFLSAIATASTTVLNEPILNFTNISITKTDSPDPVTASTNLTYQINITGSGNGTAFNVTVNDTYPAQVIYLASQPTPLAGTNNTWILGNLTQGTNISINITVLVLNITSGAIINNTANVTYNNETSGLLSAIATAATTVLNAPLINLTNMSITKFDNPDPVNASSNLTYQINISSTGNGTAYSINVLETYPNEVIYLDALPAPTTGNSTWALGNFTAGTNLSINITVLVLNITNGSVINNTAEVVYNSGGNNIMAFQTRNVTINTTVLNEPILNFTNTSITKTDSPDPVTASQNLTYQINVSSTGNGTAYNVTVNDTYPNEVIYLTSSPTPIAGTNNSWNLGNLTAGINRSINITVLVRNITNGTVINNTANVTYNNETSGLLSALTTASTTVLNPPMLNFSNISVTKTSSPNPVAPGAQLSYTIVVTSTGNGTAYNVTVNDTYPSSVIFDTSQPSPVAGTNNSFIIGNLSPSIIVQLNITVNVSASTPDGTVITNLANATFNNETSALLSASGSASTTVTSGVGPTPGPGGGGGGGGGGGVKRNQTAEQPPASQCFENWVCDDWSACFGNRQVRECSDINACGTRNYVPARERQCIKAPEKIEAPSQDGVLPFKEIIGETAAAETPAGKTPLIEIPAMIAVCPVAPVVLDSALILFVLFILAYFMLMLRKKRRGSHLFLDIPAAIIAVLLIFNYATCAEFLLLQYIIYAILVVFSLILHLIPVRRKAPIAKTQGTDKFYDRLEELDRELAKKEGAKPHVGAVKQIRKTPEEERIERELDRLVREKAALSVKKAPEKKESLIEKEHKPGIIKKIFTPAREKQFYKNLEELDRKLAQEEKAKPHAVKAIHIDKSAEDKRIEKELNKFAHEKIAVPKPSLFSRLFKPKPARPAPKPAAKPIVKPVIIKHTIAKPEPKPAIIKPAVKPKPIVIKHVPVKLPQPKPVIVKPAREKQFYKNLEELDRKLAQEEKAKPHAVKAIHIDKSAEDKRIEKELNKFAHEKIAVPKPSLFSRLFKPKPAAKPIVKPEPVKAKPVEKPIIIKPFKPKPVVIKHIPVKLPQPKPIIVKPAREKQFYKNLEELDRKLAQEEKAKPHAVKAIHIDKSAEDKRIESGLGRIAHEKITVPKPGLFSRLFKPKAAQPAAKPAPVKPTVEQKHAVEARQITVKPAPIKQAPQPKPIVVKPAPVKQVMAVPVKQKPSKDRQQFYSRMKALDDELAKVERRLKTRRKAK